MIIKKCFLLLNDANLMSKCYYWDAYTIFKHIERTTLGFFFINFNFISVPTTELVYCSNQARDAVFCQLCPNPVEHYCNLCQVNFCSVCISKNTRDKKKDVVEFIARKEGALLPECNLHKKTDVRWTAKLVKCQRGHCALQNIRLLIFEKFSRKKPQQIIADLT